MKKRTTIPAIYVPTLLDRADHRHIATEDAPALCGATGTLEAAREHSIDTLCLPCRLAYARQIAVERMTRFGL